MKHAIWILLSVFMLGIGCGSDNPAATSVEQQAVIVDTSFTLAPGESRDYFFSVDLFSQEDVTVRGDFTASGESNSEINVAVMTETEFLLWQTLGSATMVYESGAVASGELNLSLSETGSYRLVYSNVSDMAVEKSVTASVSIFYFKIGE